MTTHSFTLHITDESDASTISEVETRAFGYRKEAESACPTLSLLARHQGKAVGHILFTRATFKGANEGPLMHVLAPLASFLNTRAWGGLLIRTGLEHLRLMGSLLVLYSVMLLTIHAWIHTLR